MIDLLIGVFLGFVAGYAVCHFRNESPTQRASELSFVTNLKTEITKMIQDALNDLKAAADAKEAKAVSDAVAAATAAAPDPAAAVAEAQAADEQAVRDFTAANFPPAA